MMDNNPMVSFVFIGYHSFKQRERLWLSKLECAHMLLRSISRD
jgi:hypothetical protein